MKLVSVLYIPIGDRGKELERGERGENIRINKVAHLSTESASFHFPANIQMCAVECKPCPIFLNNLYFQLSRDVEHM